MSALNCLVLPDGVHLWTDGQLNNTGSAVLSGVMPAKCLGIKMLPLPHMQAAVTCRGLMEHMWAFAMMIGSIEGESFSGGYDGIRYFVSRYFKGTVEAAAKVAGAGPLARVFSDPFQLVVGGWSKLRREPRAFFITSLESPLAPAWQVIDIGYLFLGSPVSPELQARLDDAGEDPVRAMHDVLEYQCATEESMGQFGQHTVVTKDAITTRLLKRYPSKAAPPAGQTPLHVASAASVDLAPPLQANGGLWLSPGL
jgi:hypothetical protein